MILNETLTFYEVLELSTDANAQEIREAYVRTKNTFNRDSVALYSIINTADREDTLKKIEEAYLVLSDPEKRRAYDKSFGLLHPNEQTFVHTIELPTDSTTPATEAPTATIISIDRAPPMETLENSETFLIPPTTDFNEASNPSLDASKLKASPPPKPQTRTQMTREIKMSTSAPPSPFGPNLGDFEMQNYPKFRRPLSTMPTLDPTLYQAIEMETEWYGSFLKKVREGYKISLEEMTGITKVTKTYLIAIEEETYSRLPAAVYVRGFITQIAKVLKLPHEKVANAYLKRYHRSQRSA